MMIMKLNPECMYSSYPPPKDPIGISCSTKNLMSHMKNREIVHRKAKQQQQKKKENYRNRNISSSIYRLIFSFFHIMN